MSNVTPPIPVDTERTGSTNSLKESASTNALPKKKEDSTSEVESEESTTYVPPPRPAFRTSSNDDILAKTLGMTDLIFAIYAVELWRYDEGTGKIFNVNLSSDDEENGGGSGGLLLKRNPQETDIDNDYYTKEAEEAFYQLTDASKSNFIPAGSADPGVGLAGALWAESSGSALGGVHYRAWGEMSQLQGNISLSWRDVCELAEDPDQPFDARLQALATAGFKLATGIPFDVNGYRGMVIYYGNPHAELSKLNNPINARFMNNAAQLIGAAAAIQTPLKQIKDWRREEAFNNWHRMKIKLLTIVRMLGCVRYSESRKGGSMGGDRAKLQRKSSIAMLREASAKFKENAKETIEVAKEGAKNKATRWAKKIRGGSAGIPPSFTWRQCAWTFTGVILTHTLLSWFNLWIKQESGGDLALILAPLGALTTLQYNLTAAPASQPRNAIFGQVFAIIVAILISYIPFTPENAWFRGALAPAIVIPGMAKLGIIHPPAGAAAIIFSSGKVGWVDFGIFLVGVCMTIVTAVVINNASDRRQYPTSWYLVNKVKKSIVGENQLGQVTVIRKEKP
mmetsp:Transcript_17366/g.28529  ORF Transcript_17366/g.28529 Transcript_17366/m.28529 type:complete len:566 (+) Transcript_17366:232-1929(+)